jgi:hypothetical protein
VSSGLFTQCYQCGVVVPAEEVSRWNVKTGRVFATAFTWFGNASPVSMSASQYGRVDLCGPCARSHDAWGRMSCFGCLAVSLLAFSMLGFCAVVRILSPTTVQMAAAPLPEVVKNHVEPAGGPKAKPEVAGPQKAADDKAAQRQAEAEEKRRAEEDEVAKAEALDAALELGGSNRPD